MDDCSGETVVKTCLTQLLEKRNGLDAILWTVIDTDNAYTATMDIEYFTIC